VDMRRPLFGEQHDLPELRDLCLARTGDCDLERTITLSKYATYTLSASCAEARADATSRVAIIASLGSLALDRTTCAPYFLAIVPSGGMVISLGYDSSWHGIDVLVYLELL
jgi:hypothetical protein